MSLVPWSVNLSHSLSVDSSSKDDLKKGQQLYPLGTCTLVGKKSHETFKTWIQRNIKLVFEEEPGLALWRMWTLKDFSDIVPCEGNSCPLSWLTHFLPRHSSLFSHVDQTWSVSPMQKKNVPPFPWAISFSFLEGCSLSPAPIKICFVLYFLHDHFSDYPNQPPPSLSHP